jgi:hypothetical protein
MTFGIKSPEIVAKNLQLDYQVLTKFFNSRGFSKHASTTGMQISKYINERLHAIQNMARLIDPEVSPVDLLDDIRGILKRVSICGTSNVTAVLHIAGLRGRQSASDSAKWIRSISCAESDLMADRSPCDSYDIQFPIKLPDLTNSPYLYRVRVSQEQIDIMFSDARIVYAQATKSLLDDGYERQLAMYLARKQEREKSNSSPLKRRETSEQKESTSVEKISGKISEYLNRSSTGIIQSFGMKISL